MLQLRAALREPSNRPFRLSSLSDNRVRVLGWPDQASPPFSPILVVQNPRASGPSTHSRVDSAWNKYIRSDERYFRHARPLSPHYQQPLSLSLGYVKEPFYLLRISHCTIRRANFSLFPSHPRVKVNAGKSAFETNNKGDRSI